jgi:hypothetical protein
MGTKGFFPVFSQSHFNIRQNELVVDPKSDVGSVRIAIATEKKLGTMSKSASSSFIRYKKYMPQSAFE